MRDKISLSVRPLASLTGITAKFPTQALIDYFGALGWPLSFTQGVPLPDADDPADHPDEIGDFCSSLAPNPRGTPAPGVVIIGDMSVEGPWINGALLDLDMRGVCMIFSQSAAFERNDSEEQFEIYAHEIGHMLNLSHDDANDPFTTAMNQWDERSAVNSRKVVWNQAISAGSLFQRTNLPLFFGNGKRSPIGLPMSATCCDWLAQSDQNEIIPWKTRFKDFASAGGNDVSHGLVECRLVLQTAKGSVAQSVDFRIQVAPKQNSPSITLPHNLDLRSGLIEFYVISPDGLRRKYKSRALTCGTERINMTDRPAIRRNYSLAADSAGVLFPKPGIYGLQAAVPTLGAYSDVVEFAVDPSVGHFGDRAFQEFITRDFPRETPEGWRAVEELLASREVSPSTKAFLKSKAAARKLRPFPSLDELERDAAPRIQERDALLRVVRLRQKKDAKSVDLEKAVDAAEGVFRATDDSNPSLLFLEHVRQSTKSRRRQKGSR